MDSCLLRAVSGFVKRQKWSEAEEALTTPRFLELVVESGAAVELLEDFIHVANAKPGSRPRQRVVAALGDALRSDVDFIKRNPQTLFQCMWNRCWLYDYYEGATHYRDSDERWSTHGSPLEGSEPMVCELLERWRRQKERHTPGFLWLRSLRPPHISVGSGKMAAFQVREGPPSYLGFSQDEETVIVVLADGSVQYRATSTGTMEDSIDAIESGYRLLAVSPDYRLIAEYDMWKRELRVMELDRSRAALRHIARMDRVRGQIHDASFSCDGSFLAGASQSGAVHIWDTRSGRQLARLRASKESVRCAGLSEDGRHLITGSVTGDVRIWDVRSGRELLRRREHSSMVTTAQFLREGTHAVTSGLDERTVLWDMRGPRLVRYFEGMRPRGVKATYRSNGFEFLAAWDDGVIRRWDIRDAREVSTWQAVDGETAGFAFCEREGLAAACSRTHVIELLDTAQERYLETLEGHEAAISSMAFTLDGTLLASGSWDCSVRLWDTAARRQVHVFAAGDSGIECIALSPHAEILAAGTLDGTLYLEDLRTRSNLLTLGCSDSGIECVGFSPDGRQIAIAYSDQTIQTRDLGGRVLANFRPGWRGAHGDRITSLAYFQRGSRIASCSVDGRVCIWRAGDGRQLGGARKHRRGAYCVVSCPVRGELLTAHEDGIVRLCSPSGRTRKRFVVNPTKLEWWTWKPGRIEAFAVHAVEEQPDDPVPERDAPRNMRIADIASSSIGGFVVGATEHRTVRIWPIAQKEPKSDLVGQTSSLTTVAVSPSARLIAAASTEGVVCIWSPPFHSSQTVLRDHEDVVSALAVSPDGTSLASASGEGFRIWDTRTALLAHRCGHHNAKIKQIVYAPNGLLIASGDDGGVVNVWNSVDGARVTSFCEHGSEITGIVFSCDNETVATSSRHGPVFVWAASNGRVVGRFDVGRKTLQPLVFSPGGDVLVGGDVTGTVFTWDVASGRQLWRRQNHKNKIGCLAFSPDGTALASGGWDGNVVVWSSYRGAVITTVQPTGAAIKRVGFSKNGRQLFVCSGLEVSRFKLNGADRGPLFPQQSWRGVPDSRPLEQGHAYLLRQSQFESVISCMETGEDLAFWPFVRQYYSHPFEPLWFGTTGGYVEIFRLEGRVCRTETALP